MNCFYSVPRGYDDKFISLKVCNWNETVSPWALSTLIHSTPVRWFNSNILTTPGVISVRIPNRLILPLALFIKVIYSIANDEIVSKNIAADTSFSLRTWIVVAIRSVRKHFDNNPAVNVCVWGKNDDKMKRKLFPFHVFLFFSFNKNLVCLSVRLAFRALSLHFGI